MLIKLPNNGFLGCVTLVEGPNEMLIPISKSKVFILKTSLQNFVHEDSFSLGCVILAEGLTKMPIPFSKSKVFILKTLACRILQMGIGCVILVEGPNDILIPFSKFKVFILKTSACRILQMRITLASVLLGKLYWWKGQMKCSILLVQSFYIENFSLQNLVDDDNFSFGLHL